MKQDVTWIRWSWCSQMWRICNCGISGEGRVLRVSSVSTQIFIWLNESNNRTVTSGQRLKSVCLLHKNPATRGFEVLINTADASSAPRRSIFKSNIITSAFTCLLHLVAVLSRRALRTTRAWKTYRTLDAIATGGTHVTFFSLNIGPID